MERKQIELEEGTVNIIRAINKDKLYIILIAILFLLIIVTAHAAHQENQATIQYYKEKMADCGCIEPEPYQYKYNMEAKTNGYKS